MNSPRVLGRYEVVDLIAQGGMGALYRARDPLIGRYVAIKLLRSGNDADEFRDRFAREARAAGSLSHPNIVTIYDVGEYEGLPFIAMEYVRGETFADLARVRPPLALSRKLQLAVEVCAGLAHAHDAGIVHRDIKPANLIVGPEGTVKILDFGVARFNSSDVTQVGAVLGTLRYMSPEQLQGQAVDARTDVFSFGAVLYELLSHQPAFPGERYPEITYHILNRRPVPITQFCPDIHPDLIQLIDDLLEKNLDRRIRDITHVRDVLEAIRRRGPRNGVSAASTPPQDFGPEASRPAPSSEEAPVVESRRHLTQRESPPARAAVDAAQVLASEPPGAAAIRFPAKVDPDRARAAANAARLANARAAIQRAQFELAEREITRVLGLDAANVEALDLKAKVEAALAARRDEERAREERRQLITSLSAEAQERIAEGRLDAVAAILDRLRALDPRAPDVAAIEQKLHEAEAMVRREAMLARAIGDLDDRLRHDDLDGAEHALHDALALGPSDERVRSGRQRVNDAKAAAETRAAAEARRRAADEQLKEVESCLSTGDLRWADELLTTAAAFVPDHELLPDLTARLKAASQQREAEDRAERLRAQVSTLLQVAGRRLESGGTSQTELVAALRDIKQALDLDPDNADALTLKATAERTLEDVREALRIAAVIDNARRRFATGKHQAAIQLLEDFQPVSHPSVVAAMAELRAAYQRVEAERQTERERLERQARVTGLLAQAQMALQAEQHEAALKLLAEAEQVDPLHPDVSALRRQVLDAQMVAQRLATLEQLLPTLDAALHAEDLTQASTLLDEAATLGDDDPRVHRARQRRDAIVAAREAATARLRECDALTKSAEAALAQGDLPAARNLVASALALDAQQPTALALQERIEAAIRANDELEEAAQQRRAIESLLDEVEQQLNHGGPRDLTALAGNVAFALHLDPEHARARQLKPQVDAALASQLDLARFRAAIRAARARMAEGKPQSAIRILESLGSSAHEEVTAALVELKVASRDNGNTEGHVTDDRHLQVAGGSAAGAPSSASGVPTAESTYRTTWASHAAHGRQLPAWLLPSAGGALVVSLILALLARC